MIVLDPPVTPAHLTLVTTHRSHQAVEVALRIARLDFICDETVNNSMEWFRLLEQHGANATFIVKPRNANILTIDIVDGIAPADAEWKNHKIVKGAQGVLDLAALLSTLAAI